MRADRTRKPLIGLPDAPNKNEGAAAWKDTLHRRPAVPRRRGCEAWWDHNRLKVEAGIKPGPRHKIGGTMRYIIGIDPGITGAVAFLNGDDVTIFDTPYFTVKGKKSKTTGKPSQRKIYDDDGMAGIISDLLYDEDGRGIVPNYSCHCFIEKVGAMPGEGAVGAFSFGCGWGIWRGILAGNRIPRTFVTPQAWKKEIMKGISDKTAARVRASQLFPRQAHLFKLAKHDGRAEAALIAKYGQLFLGR